jgi:GNAT superfamily N-acetyltransferase
MDKQYYLDCLDTGTKLYWYTLGKLPGMSLHTGDIEWVMSVLPDGVERIFNICIKSEYVDDALNELIYMIKSNKAPSGILITPSSKPDNIIQILCSKSFTIDYDTGSGMAMDIDSSIYQIKPAENIEIVRVKDKETLKTWASIVNTALFETELFTYEQVCELFMLDNTYFYLGLINGQPASTCMAITDGYIATIEMVSTLKEYRKNGLGTAVTATTLQELLNIGIKTAILRAEKEAVIMYKNIGFVEFYKRVVANYNL